MLFLAANACEHHNQERSSWKHPWVCIMERSGSYKDLVLWVWVNDILLESSNEALILDCCVMPTHRLTEASVRHGTAVELGKYQAGGAGVHYTEVKLSVLFIFGIEVDCVVDGFCRS